MLTLLLREQIGWMVEERAGRMSPAYRRLIGARLLKLQRLMGHSRIESTYIYLDHLDDAQALVDAALEQWGLDVASERARREGARSPRDLPRVPERGGRSGEHRPDARSATLPRGVDDGGELTVDLSSWSHPAFAAAIAPLLHELIRRMGPTPVRRTLYCRVLDLRRFWRFLDETATAIDSVDDVTVELVDRYENWLEQNTPSQVAVRRLMSPLIAVLRLAAEKDPGRFSHALAGRLARLGRGQLLASRPRDAYSSGVTAALRAAARSQTAQATTRVLTGDGGIAAMEVVARDLKALGLYAARSLSYEGVEVEMLEHKLTPQQIRIYDAYAGAFQVIHRNLDAALKAANVTSEQGTLNRQAKAAARSAFESNKQRFFNHLITAMKVPTLIRAIAADLAADNAAIVQLVSTSEALMERRLAQIPAGEWNELSVDVTPREYVLDYLAHGFPTQLHETYSDEDGNLLSRPVFVDGQPVHSREAEQRRDRLIEHLAALPPVQAALDQIIHHFGTDAVAEVTGRGRRIVRKRRRDGSALCVENRPGSANLAETQAFMDGSKTILIFSDAGGTGRSYHADLASRNRAAAAVVGTSRQPHPPDRRPRRRRTPDGALALEIVERAAEPETAPHTSLHDRILAALAEAGSPIRFADLRQRCRVRAATLYERLAALSAAGRIGGVSRGATQGALISY